MVKHAARPSRSWIRMDMAKSHAIRIRKLLMAMESDCRTKEASGNHRDALASVDLLIALANKGKRASAADASDAAELVEEFSHQLAKQINELLARLGQVREW